MPLLGNSPPINAVNPRFAAASLQAVGERVDVQGKDTGLHAFLTVKEKGSEAEWMERALRNGVKVYGTARYWVQDIREYPSFLLGYGALNEQEIEAGIRQLAAAWFG